MMAEAEMPKRTTERNKTHGWKSYRLYLPAYRLAEAARLTGTTGQTISRWYRGYSVPGHRMKPVLPSDGTPLLSYLQLVEVAFVADFRRSGVKLDRLRQAHEYCRKTFSSEYPFAQYRFKTDGVHVLAEFMEHEGGWRSDEHLITTDAGGQVVWVPAIRERLDQFDYEHNVAFRWHPRGRSSVILIDPRIAFGAPVIGDTGLPTWVVKERYEAGEELQEIEEDFDIARPQVEAALEFEGVALRPAA
jgi:uncharacterized protein (DUF433 family)